MTRQEIEQFIFNKLGTILVDKSEIQADSTFEDLGLDDDDVSELFSTLETRFGFTFPGAVRERAARVPEHLTLNFLVDFVLTMGNNNEPGP